MKKGQIVEGKVIRIDFPNKGIVEVENETKTVVVKNTVEGQRVRASVNKIRKGKAEGRLMEVLEKSPLEIEPACPHFADCGGCTYQNLPYEEQLAMKERQVRELLAPYVTEEQFEGIHRSPRQFAYRNKMEFSFGDEYKDGPLALGMHKRGGFYDIVTVDQCRITDEDFHRILSCVKEFFASKNVPFYHKLRHTGYLRHLLVRKAVHTEEILVDLVTSSQTEFLGGADEKQMLAEMTEQLRNLPLDGRLCGVLHTVNDSLADVIQNDETQILYGEDFFYEELLGLKFRISPFSFFQTNSLAAEVLYEIARGYVGETRDKVLFDLYSGTGTIAQILAPVAKKVIGIEIVEEAVEAAKVNAELNGLTNCEFIAGDVLKAIDLVEERPDFIVLDPPRDGIHPKALQKIMNFQVDKMVYISCKPTSLARDLEILQAGGYQVEKACCADLFPGTLHVETVCLLSKLKTKQHIEVEINLDEMDMTTAESKATYEEIKDYVLEHTGLKVSNLYIAQVKQKHGIIERVNYNLPKNEDSRQPKCPEEKVKAIEDALRFFQMIK